MTVSHAVDTPPTMTPNATPAIRSSELLMYSGSTVDARCRHVPYVGVNTLLSTTSTGSASTLATTIASTPSGDGPVRARQRDTAAEQRERWRQIHELSGTSRSRPRQTAGFSADLILTRMILHYPAVIILS
jgi:hypothetical protein